METPVDEGRFCIVALSAYTDSLESIKTIFLE